MENQRRIRTLSESKQKIPLPDAFFKDIHISKELIDQWKQQTEAMLQETIAILQENRRAHFQQIWEQMPWKLHAKVGSLRAYKSPHPANPSTTQCLLIGMIPGNYQDITDFFHTNTRTELFNAQKHLFRFTADAAVIQDIKPKEEQSTNTSMGVKWVFYKPWTMRFRAAACYFESTGFVASPFGKQLGYRIVLPVEIPECPELFTLKRTVRMSMKSVTLFLPSTIDTDVTEVFMSAELDFQKNRIPKSYYKRFMTSLLRINKQSFSRYADPQYILNGRNQWVKKQQDIPIECGFCHKPFSLLRSKHVCRLCGDLVCRVCMVSTRPSFADTPELSVNNENKEEPPKRVCFACCIGIVEDNRSSSGSSTPSPSSDPTPEKEEMAWLVERSRRESNTTMISVDTKDMTPVVRCPSPTADETLDKIRQSLQDQEELLRWLQFAVQATTD